jgi:hypothetical protein
MRVSTVRLSPRTAWQSHSLGQTLHVTEGVGIRYCHGMCGVSEFSRPGCAHQALETLLGQGKARAVGVSTVRGQEPSDITLESFGREIPEA